MKTKKSLFVKIITYFGIPVTPPLKKIIVPVAGYSEFVRQQSEVMTFFAELRLQHIKKARYRFIMQLLLTLSLLFAAAIYFSIPLLPVLSIVVIAFVLSSKQVLTSGQIKKAAVFTKELPYEAQYFTDFIKGTYFIGVPRKNDMIQLYDKSGTKIFAIRADGDITLDEFKTKKRKKVINSFSTAANMRKQINANLNAPYWHWSNHHEWKNPITVYQADEYGRTNDIYYCQLV